MRVQKAPCPICGTNGTRLRQARRQVRTLAYQQFVVLDITYGEHQARCYCCTTFRNNPDGVLPKARYDNKARQTVLDRLRDDGLSVEATLHSLRRDFLLDLSSGFLYDCLYDAAAATDLAEHRQQVLERSRGELCVDEIHLGRFTLLLATDPLAFALVSANDQGHMARSLRSLKHWGLRPKVVVTDRSPLYPAVLAELWPAAERQLCVFHVLQEVNDLMLRAVRRLQRTGNTGRGRPTRAQQRRARRRGPTAKDKAHFVFQRRYLIVTREDNLGPQQRKDLRTLLEYAPGLRTLRKFVLANHRLFATDQSEPQAWCRWHALRRSPEYAAVPRLARVLELLSERRFRKMIAYLRGSPRRRARVRTNNHVGRCNRQLCFLEKGRYKWRRRRTLVRFVMLTLDQRWQRTLPGLKPERKRRRTTRPRAQVLDCVEVSEKSHRGGRRVVAPFLFLTTPLPP